MPPPLGDALRLDGRGGLRRGEHHLRTGVEVLPRASKRDAGEARARLAPGQDAHGVEVAHVAAKRARDPLDLAFFLNTRAFGVEVVHVLRPVFDCGVAQMRPLAHKELNGAGVQVRHVVLGRRAALDKVQVGVVLHDDERVLKLARACRIQAEVALQGELQLGTSGNIHKRSARPHGAVQGGKLVVGGRDERHKLLVDELFPARLVERLFNAGVHDAHVGGRLLHVVIHKLGVVLGAHAREVASLRLGDAQPLKGVLDVVGHRVPIGLLVGVGLHVGNDVVHVEARDAGAPRSGLGMEW